MSYSCQICPASFGNEPMLIVVPETVAVGRWACCRLGCCYGGPRRGKRRRLGRRSPRGRNAHRRPHILCRNLPGHARRNRHEQEKPPPHRSLLADRRAFPGFRGLCTKREYKNVVAREQYRYAPSPPFGHIPSVLPIAEVNATPPWLISEPRWACRHSFRCRTAARRAAPTEPGFGRKHGRRH